ncbi:multiple epidermal growth factor-like domains protein 11 [Haliotis rubra]|uniref:multiple epidermal growth factor-like domains protein 11 n=1 Tax=Haliotis rubra TaxID=36100 RepID=UPI001EE601BC|nr:multiple epidermal growth factor-like domains protein 11 [Haliotis rubra]
MALWACVVLWVASLCLAAGVRQNVAQGTPAWMSTTRQPTQSAGNAVDGVTTATSDRYSAHTSESQANAWWKVDLQLQVQSPVVSIYFRTDYKKRRNGLQLYTSGTNSSDPKEGDICDTVRGRADGTDIPDVLNVTCPGTWRYLTVYTETDNDEYGAILDFAEVQVWVPRACDLEHYGVNCGQSCDTRHCKMDSSCDVTLGQCVGGCAAGYQGTDCTQACGTSIYGEECSKSCSSRHCQTPSNTCDHVTGRCPNGCMPGYTGDDCLQSSACASGRYGDSCSKDCNSRYCLNTRDPCPPDTGACSACQPGWAGPDCTECVPGRYGDSCSKYCNSRYCLNTEDSCPSDTGACSACQPGWAGPDCTECVPGRYGDSCSKYCNSRHCRNAGDSCPPATGACSWCQPGWARPDCTECVPGRYGDSCSKYCNSRHCRNAGDSCPPATGACSWCQPAWARPDCTACISECVPGRYGDSCSKYCNSRHCRNAGDSCPPATGACSWCQPGWARPDCTVCASGYYGSSCNQLCSNTHCSHTCGGIQWSCIGGCLAGYHGQYCTQVCNSRNYGANCGQSCAARGCKMASSCNVTHGQCVGGCAAGYQGTDCRQACTSGVTYGDNCSKSCYSRHCVNNLASCPPNTGACSSAGCQAGWAGTDCTVCASWYYGANCGQSCAARHCKMDSSCDVIQGECVGGCAAGYQGTDCTQACASGSYGDSCSKDCNSRHCFNTKDQCPPVTGACSWCQPGWARPDCTVCASGYYGSSCNQLCSNTHCSHTCGGIQWNCIGGCLAGYHGHYCTQVCNSGYYGANCGQSCAARHCKMDSSCDVTQGQCVGGCAAGYHGTDCRQACTSGVAYGDNCSKYCNSRHCVHNLASCPPDTGACSSAGCRTGWAGTDCTGCLLSSLRLNNSINNTGYYGANCGQSCDARQCKMDFSCDVTQGRCVGGCADGYQGIDCRQECVYGMYGEGCSKSCSNRHCKTPSNQCNHVTGRCPAGCVTGFTGDDCLQNCPDGYYGTTCSLSCAERHCNSSSCPTDGACGTGCEAGWTLQSCTQECPRGKYGVNCDSVCGHCADNITCDHITGTCPGGCQPGWQHQLCQTGCDNGKFGSNCERDCGQCNGTCDVIDGRCPWGCTEGYNGSHCSVKLSPLNKMQSSNVLVPAVSGTVVGLLVVAIVVAVVVLVGRRRRRFQDSDVTKHSAHFRPEENGALANVVLDENRTGHQKPPIKPKPAPQAASSKQLSSEDEGHEEEDLDEEVQPPDSCYYNAEAEDAIRDVAVPELAATVAMLKQRKDGFEREYNMSPLCNVVVLHCFSSLSLNGKGGVGLG